MDPNTLIDRLAESIRKKLSGSFVSVDAPRSSVKGNWFIDIDYNSMHFVIIYDNASSEIPIFNICRIESGVITGNDGKNFKNETDLLDGLQDFINQNSNLLCHKIGVISWGGKIYFRKKTKLLFCLGLVEELYILKPEFGK